MKKKRKKMKRELRSQKGPYILKKIIRGEFSIVEKDIIIDEIKKIVQALDNNNSPKND